MPVASRVLLLLASGLVVAGCFSGFSDYDQRGDADISARISAANSPLISHVNHREGDYMDPATIVIYMASDTDAAAVRTVLCDIAIPARTAGRPSDGLSIEVVDEAAQLVGLDLNFDCSFRPSPPSPSASGSAAPPS